ncbi:NAD(P)-dependent oxidoreductase [Synechococcus sp. CCY9202]|uniref:NAD-dependent epimerase/dehydratase family protein n=1 Tax=Synechococcus sp. CCY9202 TaxID=174698 RepID=UPI002B218F62|nr:NAD(P)-dependent oxidoreductase [Synechococcus sp. CCY9202]MEA5423124.1 NAD(P)-dependent oxidoreductase [Synechococcus sp. CCY9202]
MRILLTGGTGFIGSHFLNQALAAGHNVLALRRSSASTPRILIDSQPDWLDRQLDEVTARDIEGCDVLVHLAAHSVQYPFDSLIECLRWNLMAVLALFEQARLAGIRNFIVAGSCFEYGRSGERFAAIPTDAPLEPANSYAASKAAASVALCQWAEEHQLNLEMLRVFHVYGKGESSARFWPMLRKAAFAGEDFPMTEGEQIRDFLAVEDVASLFLGRAAELQISDPRVRIFNLSSGNPCTLREFSHRLWLQWNAKGNLLFGQIPYRPNEVMRYCAGADSLTIQPKSCSVAESLHRI